jgi:hypothetical protein
MSLCAILAHRVSRLGVSCVSKQGYVAPSREGLVALTVWVKPDIRQALKIAAARHSITVADIMEGAIASALKKYAKAKD